MKTRRLIAIMLAASLLIISPAGTADAKSVYEATCTACHGFGVAGAPRPGDKADWVVRITQGIEVLYAHAIDGFSGQTGFMPPKGGFPDLSDEQIKAIVDYMVAESK